jgi:hypothetical protein
MLDAKPKKDLPSSGGAAAVLTARRTLGTCLTAQKFRQKSQEGLHHLHQDLEDFLITTAPGTRAS